MTKYKSVTGSHRQLATQETRRTAGVVTAAAFAIALGLAAFTGTVALNEASLVIPEWVNAGGHCLRASRTSTFVTASLPLGSPSRIVKLLVRLDRVEPTKHTVLTIFAQDLLRSTSLKCDGRNCSDTALLTTHTDGSQHVGTIQFEYGNQYQTDFQLEQSLGVEGSLSLVQGFSYHLSATHFCWKEGALAPPTTGTVLPVHVQASALYTSAQELRDTALAAPATACNGSIALFPTAATSERAWLALSSDLLFESQTDQLDERRRLAEQGLACAPEGNQKELYELDCSLDVFATCNQEPSFPFRRLSQYELSFHLQSNATLTFEQRQSLSRLSGSTSLSESVFFATIRLTVLLIVAFVVYNRADRASSSAYFTIHSAIRIAAGADKHTTSSLFHVVTDAAIGLLAVVSRILVLVFQAQLLVDDACTDLVALEYCACVASLVHFALRHFVLETDLSKEPPFSKLGSSMSLTDASVAALLSVIKTPLLAASARDFDAVARLFAAVLISLFVFHRLFFSFSACALLATTTSASKRFDRSYSIVLWTAVSLWAIQIVATSFSFGRLFVVPQAYSLARVGTGSARSVEFAVWITSLTLSVPYINSIVGRLIKN